MDCPRCHLPCESQQALVDHALLTHLPEATHQKFPCVLCNKELVSVNALRTHYRVIHLKMYSPKKCKQCLTTFETPRAMLEHRAAAHPIPRATITCPTCHRGFSSVRRLELHQKHAADETPEGLFLCDHCPKLFRTHRERRRHTTTYHAPPAYHCSIEGCSAVFHTQYALQSHLETHERAKKRTLQCPSCVKVYATHKSLQRHIGNFHSATSPRDDLTIPCLRCNRRFSSTKNLKAHWRNFHDPQRPKHKCSLCDYFALHASTIEYHEREVHGVIEGVVVPEE